MPLRSNFMHFCIIFVKVLNRYKLVYNWLYKRNEKNLSSMKIKRNNVTERVFADRLLKKCRMVKIVSIIVVMTMLLSVVPVMPVHMTGTVPNSMSGNMQNMILNTAQGNVSGNGSIHVTDAEASDNELAADTSVDMDNSTKSALGSLFDMDDD